ncbi:MAG: hypothetical protein ACOY33_13465 [Pseudomonadota bacterium]
MPIHRSCRALAVALLAFLLGACANNMADRAANGSVVYGYIDMSEAPTGLDWLSLLQVKPKTKEPYWQTGTEKVEKGYLFFHYGLTPGTYQISEFGGADRFLIFSGTPYVYSFSRQGRNESAIEIGKPGVYFIGAFKYKRIKNGFFKADNFDVVAVKEHPPKQLMLDTLLREAPEHAVVQSQLKAAGAKAAP